MFRMIPLQLEFRQEVPSVCGNKDYEQYRKLLERINELITESGIEVELIKKVGEKNEEIRHCEMAKAGEEYTPMSRKESESFAKRTKTALRCNIARALLDLSYRPMSARLADSPLLRWFCLDGQFGAHTIKVPSKSELERMDKLFPSELQRTIITSLLKAASDEAKEFPLGLEEAVSLENYYADTTCVKINIHYPVDWILFRDITRTLMKAVGLIRTKGLKNRMIAPERFMKEMNNLCIKMGHLKRCKDGRKKRKAVLRLMKKLVKKVEAHAQRHKELLELHWEATELSEAKMKQIVMRIEGVVKQLPQAVKQAHDRIIGERKQANENKILSIYEADVHVQIRKKDGANAEFGNRLLLAEQEDGIIVDWKLYQKEPGSDAKLLSESLKRFEIDYALLPKRVGTDRGFDSVDARKYLKGKNIENCMCPRSVRKYEEQLDNESFCRIQNRRSQTEGRIGIFKNCFLGKPFRSKGFSHQDIAVGWSVLAHNLWVLARLPQADTKRLATAA